MGCPIFPFPPMSYVMSFSINSWLIKEKKNKSEQRYDRIPWLFVFHLMKISHQRLPLYFAILKDLIVREIYNIKLSKLEYLSDGHNYIGAGSSVT